MTNTQSRVDDIKIIVDKRKWFVRAGSSNLQRGEWWNCGTHHTRNTLLPAAGGEGGVVIHPASKLSQSTSDFKTQRRVHRRETDVDFCVRCVSKIWWMEMHKICFTEIIKGEFWTHFAENTVRSQGDLHERKSTINRGVRQDYEYKLKMMSRWVWIQGNSCEFLPL